MLLGPWQLGQDPLESALLSFEGVAGGPAVHPWEAGLRQGVGYAMVEEAEAGAEVRSMLGDTKCRVRRPW
jgi:hypothetical protein